MGKNRSGPVEVSYLAFGSTAMFGTSEAMFEQVKSHNVFWNGSCKVHHDFGFHEAHEASFKNQALRAGSWLPFGRPFGYSSYFYLF